MPSPWNLLPVAFPQAKTRGKMKEKGHQEANTRSDWNDSRRPRSGLLPELQVVPTSSHYLPVPIVIPCHCMR